LKHLKKYPILAGKIGTFWHIISSGKDEQSKEPETDRCVKIKWIRFMIENSNSLYVWENERNTKKGMKQRICISDLNFDYVVILEERSPYVLLWTAYPLIYKHSKQKARREYDLYKARIAPKSDPVIPSTRGR